MHNAVVFKIVNSKTKLFSKCISFLMVEYDTRNRTRSFWIERFSSNSRQPAGFCMLHDERVVGFFGLIESKGIIALSTWYVNKNYRGNSMEFLAVVMKYISGDSVVNSSPNPIAYEIFTKLYRFNAGKEYLGVPKKIFSRAKVNRDNIYFGKRINVSYDKNISLLQLLFLSIKYRKITLALMPTQSLLTISKKIDVLYRDINYRFPLSISGDVYD